MQMKKLLPLILVPLIGGCPAGTLGSGAAALQEAAMTQGAALGTAKDAIVGLGDAVASFRDLKASASTQRRGSSLTQASPLSQAAAYRLFRTLGTVDDDEIPDVPYSDVVWYDSGNYDNPTTTMDGDSYVIDYEGVQEGRVPKGTTGVKGYLHPETGEIIVEQYFFTMSQRAQTDGSFGYKRTEDVKLSQFRHLGSYVTEGTTKAVNGRLSVNNTQRFTPKDGGATKTTSLTSQFEDNRYSFTVKGELPKGGTIDLTNTIVYVLDSQGTSGTMEYSQKGAVTSAKGDTFLLDLDTKASFSYSNGTYSGQNTGHLDLTVKDKIVLHFDMDYGYGLQEGDTKISGAVYSADATRTKLGDIKVNPETLDATIAYTDGKSETLGMEPLFDAMAAGQDFQF